MSTRYFISLACFWLLAGSGFALADTIVSETFTGYPDNALISASPAGPALGLTGDWQLSSESDFYVNRTEADPGAGTGKAVYDMPFDDNGSREASRATADDHILFSEDGDVFFASFLVLPARSAGYMSFTLVLNRLDGGGQTNVSFGMAEGRFTVGNDGVVADASGGTPAARETLVVMRVEYGDSSSGPDDNEIITLWADPVNTSSDPAIDNVPVDFLNRGGGTITAVAIRGEHMAGQPAFFDDLRVGLTFEDVTGDTQVALSEDLGVNGLFFDASNPGHGFDFNVHEAGFTVFYYGHTATGERLWLISELFKENLEFAVPFELEMFEVINGVFGSPVQPETFWGTITFSLADCDSGHASFSGLDGDLEMDFIRLVGLPGISCQ